MPQHHGFEVRDIHGDCVIVDDIYVNDAYHARCGHFHVRGEGEVCVDVGACIGAFSRLWHEKSPACKIIAVEACPENVPILRANVGHFAEVLHAAVTYWAEPVALLNATTRQTCTGGSVVVPKRELHQIQTRDYDKDDRELPTITLEGILDRFGVDHIDMLKLDCESMEYDILMNTTIADRIHYIVGEWHDPNRWEEIKRKYAHWAQAVDGMNFQLLNPTFKAHP